MDSSEIKELRIRLKMSRPDLARALDVAPVTIKRWEQGESKPNPLAQRALALLARRVK